MYIEKIKIENFRLLQKCCIDMREKTTLLVGKNNTGKTSFAVLLEKFLVRPDTFSFTDFPLSLREALFKINAETNVEEFAIRMVLRISYTEVDDLRILSEFMLDLDPERRHTSILFECIIDKKKLLHALPKEEKERKKFIENNLSGKFLDVKLYAFDDYGYVGEQEYYMSHRNQLEEKELTSIRALLNYQVIHARRNVVSSEDIGRGSKPLSTISTKFFRKRNIEADADDVSEEGASADNPRAGSIEKLRSMLAEIDTKLGKQYEEVFGNFLRNSSDFLDIGNLTVVSNIQSQSIIENSSQVIYGDPDNFLPEQHSGLGYLNILYLLLQIELCRDDFSRRNAPLNLLLIEEPEAHTHPQMQYVFAEKIHSLVLTMPGLQALVTTHSSHIVSKSDFEDIRYLSRSSATGPVSIKNFHTDLSEEYENLDGNGKALFKFLKQYLTINSAELFFSNKAIFIEGTTERILLPLFIKMHDKKNAHTGGLSSQNISVMEVGANARAFAPFLNFIGVRTLIITDIDTTKSGPNKKTASPSYQAHPVEGSTHTSNETLKHFLSAPTNDKTDDYQAWHKRLLSGEAACTDGIIKLAYQVKENGYHARSFEDAFIAKNFDKIKNRKKDLDGLKNLKDIDNFDGSNYYALTEKILSKKSDFAGSILYAALVEGEEWEAPKYIMDGLEWIHRN